jgi:hypothetical protein
VQEVKVEVEVALRTEEEAEETMEEVTQGEEVLIEEEEIEEEVREEEEREEEEREEEIEEEAHFVDQTVEVVLEDVDREENEFKIK